MNFKSNILEGVFSVRDKHDGGYAFLVQGPDGTEQNVWELLGLYVNQEITLAFHHVPTLGSVTGWGGGSCKWEKSGWCPAGHHEDPDRILNVQGTGLLMKGDHQWDWSLSKFDGTLMRLPLQLLTGHEGRLALATQFDIEKMRKALESQGFDPSMIESLGVQAQNLQDILKHVKKATDDGSS